FWKIGQREVERLFDHVPEIFFGIGLFEFGDAAGDHVDRTHEGPPWNGILRYRSETGGRSQDWRLLTNATISPIGAPGVKISRTPDFLRSRISSSGMMPPPKRAMSAAFSFLSRLRTSSKRVMWAAEWMERPIASTSSWIAETTISAGVLCRR